MDRYSRDLQVETNTTYDGMMVGRLPSRPSSGPGHRDHKGANVPWKFVWLASIGVVLVGLAIYARSLHILPLGDDWVFLYFANHGPSYVFGFLGNYHYNPVAQGLMYVVYLLFGLQEMPFHIVALGLFSVCTILVLHLGWKVSGSFTVGVVASLLFVLNGRQYEAVVWTLVSFFQTLGLVFYLGGLLFYLYLQDQRQRHRYKWMMFGFYACMILAVFTYEQEITLVAAAALYRLLVIEHGQGFGRTELMARARVWVREFGFPAAFFAAYLIFKYWLSMKTGASQAPGLHLGLGPTVTTITIGLYQSFMPGIVTSGLLTLQQNLFMGIGWGHPLWRRTFDFSKVLVPLAAVIVLARPVYRWLAIWSVLVVASTVLGIGYLASRYELLFVVPAVILWAGLLVWLAKIIRALTHSQAMQATSTNLQRIVAIAAWLPLIVFVAGYAALGVPYTLAQEANWQQASDMEGAALQRIQALAAANPSTQTLYMVNLPDALAAPAGLFEHGAYVFQTGAPVMIVLTMPKRFHEIEYVRTPGYSSIGAPQVMQITRLDRLSSDTHNLVVCFSPTTQQIELWSSACT